MRSSEILTRLQAVVGGRAADIKTIAGGGVQGGWELWLQVELALEMLRYNVNGIAVRSAPYGNNGFISDFKVTPAKGVAMWVELKTQNLTADDTLPQRFTADVTKIDSLPKTFLDANVVVAFGVGYPSSVAQVQAFSALAPSCDPKWAVYQFANNTWEKRMTGSTSTVAQGQFSIIAYLPSS